MEARVAVLEQIAKDTRDSLRDIRDTIQRLDAKIDRLDAKIDTRIDGVRGIQERDFRILFGALIATALGLAGLMAHGFGWF